MSETTSQPGGDADTALRKIDRLLTAPWSKNDGLTDDAARIAAARIVAREALAEVTGSESLGNRELFKEPSEASAAIQGNGPKLELRGRKMPNCTCGSAPDPDCPRRTWVPG